VSDVRRGVASSLLRFYGYVTAMRRKDIVWKAVSYGAGMAATLVTQRALSSVWSRVGESPAPTQPEDRRARMLPALTWAVATGVGVGVTRLVALRSAARVWEAATSEPPPTVEA
jgi:hypothetical protein